MISDELNKEVVVGQLQKSMGSFLTATYCEKKGWYLDAANMYHSAGLTSKAVSICIQHKFYDPVIDFCSFARTDALIKQVEDMFVILKEFDRAITLNLRAGKPLQALEIISTHKLPITERLVENIVTGQPSNEEQLEVVSKILELCRIQNESSSIILTELTEMKDSLEKEIEEHKQYKKKRKLEESFKKEEDKEERIVDKVQEEQLEKKG